jgi:hypothetical protein
MHTGLWLPGLGRKVACFTVGKALWDTEWIDCPLVEGQRKLFSGDSLHGSGSKKDRY